MSEMLALVSPESYITRVSLHDVKHISQAAKATRRAFEVQMNNEGFSMVEYLSMCPTQWKVAPVEGPKWITDKMIPYYPLGNFGSIKN
jgi:2-oxoglutarate ferredoxin oxidoreductase subunit beta